MRVLSSRATVIVSSTTRFLGFITDNSLSFVDYTESLSDALIKYLGIFICWRTWFERILPSCILWFYWSKNPVGIGIWEATLKIGLTFASPPNPVQNTCDLVSPGREHLRGSYMVFSHMVKILMVFHFNLLVSPKTCRGGTFFVFSVDISKINQVITPFNIFS